MLPNAPPNAPPIAPPNAPAGQPQYRSTKLLSANLGSGDLAKFKDLKVILVTGETTIPKTGGHKELVHDAFLSYLSKVLLKRFSVSQK